MASIASDKNPFVNGKLGRDSLTNCFPMVKKSFQRSVKGDALM